MSNRIAIATTINSGWVTALRLYPNKEKDTNTISERIEQEKKANGCLLDGKTCQEWPKGWINHLN